VIRIIWTSVLAAAVAVTLVACGGGGAKDTSSEGMGQGQEASDQAAGETTPPADMDTAGVRAGTIDGANGLPQKGTYKTSYDPKAVYGSADLPMMGSYLKIDFEDLTDAQMNRVIHRLRSEYCTCGCDKDPIDQCLVNDPDCTTAVTLAKQIIREEKTKS
jgi:hypothetical protein